MALKNRFIGSNYYYWTDFRNSNGIFSGSIKVMTENCWRWKFTSGLDGKRLFAYNLRTNETNFKIQTAYVKAQLQWLIKISVAKNLLPVLAENGYLLIIQELIDEFSEFKRQMFRFDSNENLKILFLKIYFRCKQKIWKWALKHYFEKENPFRIERVTPSYQ